jgi:type II secretion system protein I
MRKSKTHGHYSPAKLEHRLAKGESGFTLIETSIAMVIMMVVALASASVFAYSIKNNSSANDRELAMGVAQQQFEQLRNTSFTDTSLTATAGTTTITRAGRSYTVVKTITASNTINGQPTLKTIAVQVTPTGSPLGAVTLCTVRSTDLAGPNR